MDGLHQTTLAGISRFCTKKIESFVSILVFWNCKNCQYSSEFRRYICLIIIGHNLEILATVSRKVTFKVFAWRGQDWIQIEFGFHPGLQASRLALFSYVTAGLAEILSFWFLLPLTNLKWVMKSLPFWIKNLLQTFHISYYYTVTYIIFKLHSNTFFNE